RYLQQRRNRLIYMGAGIVGVVVLVIVGALLYNLRSSQQQLEQKAQEAQNLSQAILAAQPTGSVTVPPSLVAIRETAAAVGTSSAKVTCQGGPDITFRASPDHAGPDEPVSLIWENAQRVTDVSIAPEPGKVNVEGQTSVRLKQTTSFTLTAEGCGGTTTRTVTVNIAQPPAPPANVPPPASATPV